MEENLANYRRSYEKSELHTKSLKETPFAMFKIWFDEAREFDTETENNTMTLSTIDADGFPKNRIVLLKKFNDKGFIFYTNYESEKGRSIKNNPKVSLSFFWPNLERQVIVKGKAEKLSPGSSDEYFSTRPRGSQISAWASPQSHAVKNRSILKERQQEFTEKFVGDSVPRPEFWGGFLVRPLSVEFWQGRANRLHDRFKYSLRDEKWQVLRLAP